MSEIVSCTAECGEALGARPATTRSLYIPFMMCGAPSGPGIEFLEYLSPRDGRAFPADEHANDLVHHQTRLMIAAGDSGARTLRDGRAPFISSGVVAMPDGSLGFHRGFLVRDPDGHVMELTEN